jgi:Ca-activated chloride channel family protein
MATRRVPLLTDGLANQGIVDPAELAATAARFRARGIATSAFGVGADFDEELLARLATEGGGHFYFIERARQIPDFLTSELGETLEVVARDVTLDLTCGHGVEAVVLNALPVEASEGRVRVRLGDLVADQEVTLAVSVTCAPHPAEATVFVDCRVTDRDAALYREPLRVDWRAASAAEHDAQPVNAGVVVAAAELIAERARTAALQANRHGDYDAARRIMRDLIQHLRALAPDHPAIEVLIARLRDEERELGDAMAPLAMKARHFERYAVAFSRDPEGRSKRRR